MHNIFFKLPNSKKNKSSYFLVFPGNREGLEKAPKLLENLALERLHKYMIIVLLQIFYNYFYFLLRKKVFAGILYLGNHQFRL